MSGAREVPDGLWQEAPRAYVDEYHHVVASSGRRAGEGESVACGEWKGAKLSSRCVPLVTTDLFYHEAGHLVAVDSIASAGIDGNAVVVKTYGLHQMRGQVNNTVQIADRAFYVAVVCQ